MFRELREYKKHIAAEHPTSVIHTTFEPISEKNDYVEFDIKSAGLTGHMSSVMYLEREFTFVLKNVSVADEQFVLPSTYEHERLYRPLDESRIVDLAFAVKPGFRLQENIKKMHFTFNGGGASFDTEWLAPYCKLYAEKLKQFVRGSGRTFSNKLDFVLRRNQLNVLNSDAAYIYCNPERNDRRIIPIYNGKYYNNDHYYYYHFTLEDGNVFRPQNIQIGALLGWNTDLQIQSNDPYAPPDLDHTTLLNTIIPHSTPNTLYAYYEFHFADDDNVRLNTVRELIAKLYIPGVVPQLKHQTGDGFDGDWNQLKAIYQEYFGAGDHFNWGVDLETPLPMHKRLLHFKTVALLYQFAYKVLRYFLNFKDFPILADIEDQREIVSFIDNEIQLFPQNQGIYYLYIQSLYNIAALTQQLNQINPADLTAINAKQAEIDEETDSQNDLLQSLLENQIYPLQKLGNESDLQFLIRMRVNPALALTNLRLDWANNSHVHDPHPFVTQANSFIRYVQIFSRLEHIMTTPKAEGINVYTVTLYEPIMVGPCMPSEHTSVGCYAKNSPVIPYIERFNLKMDFKNEDMFELDQFHMEDMITNMFDYRSYLPIMDITKTKSKLHCTFVEQPVQLPVQIPCVDTETFMIDDIVLLRDEPTVVSFKDLSLRRKPSLIMFYCKSEIDKKHDDYMLSDKSASIVKCSLSLDNYNRTFKCDTRSAIDIVSMRNYPCYIPPILNIGNVFALPFSELPIRKSVQSGYNHLHGELTIEQAFLKELPTKIFVTFMYHDRFFDVSNNYQTVRLDLDI